MPAIEQIRQLLNSTHAAAARSVVMGCGIFGFLAIFWFVFWRVRALALTAADNPGLFFDIANVVQNCVGAAFCLLGVYVASKARNHAGIWVLAMYLIAQGLATGYLNSVINLFGFSDGRSQFARLLINGVAYAAALRATQLFPGPLTARDISNLIESHPRWRYVWRLVRLMLPPWRVWALAAGLLLLVPLTPNDLFFSLGQLTVLALAVATLAANYLTGNETERRKIYWLLAGALILLVGRIAIIAGTLLIGWLDIPDLTVGAQEVVIPSVLILRLLTWTIAVSGMIVCVLLAIFYGGAINPEMVVRRTAILGAGFGLTFFTFGVFVNYIAALITEMLVLEEALVQAVAGTLIALGFRPLDNWLTRLADRYVPKQLELSKVGARQDHREA